MRQKKKEVSAFLFNVAFNTMYGKPTVSSNIRYWTKEKRAYAVVIILKVRNLKYLKATLRIKKT